MSKFDPQNRGIETTHITDGVEYKIWYGIPYDLKEMSFCNEFKVYKSVISSVTDWGRFYTYGHLNPEILAGVDHDVLMQILIDGHLNHLAREKAKYNNDYNLFLARQSQEEE